MWNQCTWDPWIHNESGYSDVRIVFGPDLTKGRAPLWPTSLPQVSYIRLRLPDKKFLRTRHNITEYLESYLEKGSKFILPFYDVLTKQRSIIHRFSKSLKSISIVGEIFGATRELLTASTMEIPLETETGKRVREIRIIPHYNWILSNTPYLDAQIK